MNKQQTITVSACTRNYGGYPPALFVPIGVGAPLGEDESLSDPLRELKAVWDTGATATSIKNGVASELGLKPTGKAILQTANGPCKVNTYLVSLTLPNKVRIRSLVVNEANLGQQGDIEMLVGMDVIRMGDFAVTNYGGKTVCTYRVPSLGHIDFITDVKPQPNRKQRRADARKKKK